MSTDDRDDAVPTSRRDFLKTAAPPAVAAAGLGQLPGASTRRAATTIKVGLIGCGGRGTGAADRRPARRPGRQDRRHRRRLRGPRRRVPQSAARRTAGEKLGNASMSPAERCFVGLDAYKKVHRQRRRLRHPGDAARLPARCTSRPPSPPASTSSPRSRSPSTAPASARCWRPTRRPGKKTSASSPARSAATRRGYLETMKRIHDGDIGDIVAGPLLLEPGRPLERAARSAAWTDVEWQMRNWYYFTWLCGDHIVEQHVHNLDVDQLGDERATRCSAVGMGGRQVAHRPGVRPHLRPLRHRLRVPQRRARAEHVPADRRLRPNSVSEAVVGTQGACNTPGRNALRDQRRTTPGRSAPARTTSPYVQEHTDLIESIRAGKPINELKNGGREHADGDHGPHVGVHRQGGHLGAGPQLQESLMPARKLAWDRCRCRRWPCRGRPSGSDPPAGSVTAPPRHGERGGGGGDGEGGGTGGDGDGGV